MIKLFEEGGDDPEKMRVRAYMEVQYRDLDKDGDGKIQPTWAKGEVLSFSNDMVFDGGDQFKWGNNANIKSTWDEGLYTTKLKTIAESTW